MDDREIGAAIAAGDPVGFAGAYDTYAESLYGYCRWMLAEPADAAEALRGTFVLTARQPGGLSDPGKFRSWLFTTARSECLPGQRRRGQLVKAIPLVNTTRVVMAIPLVKAIRLA